jgi:dTMP kinase
VARGRFVVFEGVDASGKSTQARRVANERGAHFTFEPGDTALGAQLRGWLLDAETPMTPSTEALLMLADRAHHVATRIEPLLSAGSHVVSDRYYGSTLAYQGYGRGLDLSTLESATTLAIGDCRADLTIVIDIDPDVAASRRAADGRDRFESSDAAFRHRVREGFLRLADSEGWTVIDGNAELAVVSAAVDAALATLTWTA